MSSIVDGFNPVKAWEEADEENRLTDKANWVTPTAKQRILIETPSPEARITLGFPTETFGYPGLSMQAKHYFFLDVGGRARLQFGKPVTWVAASQWYQYAGKEIILGGGSNAVFAVRNRFILSAGGGYVANAVADSGEMLPDATWNSTDMNEILDAAHWGVRAYDESSEDVETDHKQRMGYPVPPRPPVPAAATGKLAKVVAFLGGEAPKPTARSAGVVRLLDLKPESSIAALLNVVEKTSRIANAITKRLSDHTTLPFVGPLLEKVEQLKAMNGALRELLTAPQVATAARRLNTWKSGSWDDAMLHWLRLLADLANRVVRLKNAAKDLLTSAAQFFGLSAPSPSVLGLVGRDGISVVTHDDVFAWAPNGFRFVSAPNAEDYPVDPVTRAMRLLLKKEEALANTLKAQGKLGMGLGNFLFGKSAPVKSPNDPSFRVSMQGDVDLRADGDAALTARGPQSRLRAEGSLAAELAATRVVGVTARQGVVEVMGREVRIGVPQKSDAKRAAKEAASPAVAAEEQLVDRLRTSYETRAQAAIEANARKADFKQKRRDAITSVHQLQDDPALMATASELATKFTLELVKAEKEAEAADALADAARDLLGAAEVSLNKAKDRAGAVIGSSRTATMMEWKAQEQAVARAIGVHGRDEVSIYSGKTLSIEAGKSLSLTTEDLTTPTEKATIKVEKEIELQVGTFKVTVSKDKVVVNNGSTDVLVIDASGATMKTAAGAKVMAKDGEVSLDAPSDASIKANGKILLG